MWHVRETITNSADGDTEHHLFGDFLTKESAEEAASAVMREDDTLSLDVVESDELVDGAVDGSFVCFNPIVAAAEKLNVDVVGIEVYPRLVVTYGIGGYWTQSLVIAYNHAESSWGLFMRTSEHGYAFKGAVGATLN